LSRFDGMT